MAKKKTEMPGTEVTVPKNTTIVDIRAELAKEAAAIQTRIGTPSGDMIRVTQDKYFVLPDGTKSNNPLRVVILDFVAANHFYDKEFEKGAEGVPACFAISATAKNMIPSKNSPKKEAEACDICPNNEFGSSGKGKACKNLRLLAVVEDSDNEDAPICLLKVSSTAVRGFDAYVSTIKTQFDTVPVGVVTKIYFDPNVPHASLRFGNPFPNENLGVHFNRRGAALERLLTEPDVSQYKPPAPVKAAKKR